jgi:hypothetical protein
MEMTMTKILAKLTETDLPGICRWNCRIVRPDLGTHGYDYLDVAPGVGATREEATMDLQMKIAGDDFETVQIRFI